MPGLVVRMGDVNVCGGAALGGNPTVRVNGRPIMVTGMPVAPHPNFKPPHTSAITIGTSTVRAGGLPIVTSSNIDTCGHPRVFGSATVRTGS